MVRKLLGGTGCLSRLHVFCREKRVVEISHINCDHNVNTEGHTQSQSIKEKFPHVYRRKTLCELTRLSASITGVEFSYAAELSFATPILLKLGVTPDLMSLTWSLPPVLGFFLTPVLGALSDRCTLHYGRRRPFLLLLTLIILLGLFLVPFGESVGQIMGDSYLPSNNRTLVINSISNNRTTSVSYDFSNKTSSNSTTTSLGSSMEAHSRLWGIFFTVLGTVLLDFSNDASQSPARALLLDVCLPEDHPKALSTATMFAGVAGVLGHAIGGINWNNILLGKIIGGQEKTVFALTSCIFIMCTLITVTSFKEVPLDYLQKEKPQESTPSFRQFLISLVIIPWSMRILCLTNMLGWMAHVCNSIYFTDFVGEAVFKGDPLAPAGSNLRLLYEQGVMLGCWGIVLYYITCFFYSMALDKLVKIFKARTVYVGGLLIYSISMLLMTTARTAASVLVFSATAGVMYPTIFTMPYMIVANYHKNNAFMVNTSGEAVSSTQIRGLGTDISIISSMVFLAQFCQSFLASGILAWTRTTISIIALGSFFAFCSAIAASQILYINI